MIEILDGNINLNNATLNCKVNQLKTIQRQNHTFAFADVCGATYYTTVWIGFTLRNP